MIGRMTPRNLKASSACWYIEALCLGVTIGFSEVLLAIYYGSRDMDSVALAVFITVPAAFGAITQALVTRSKGLFHNARTLALASISVQVAGLLMMANALYSNEGDQIRMFIGQCLYWMGGMTSSSPTQEILAREVDAEQHNRFFSRRAMLMTILTLLCNFASANILTSGLTALLMAKLLFVAACARGLSLVLVALCSHTPTSSPSSGQNGAEDAVFISILQLSLVMMLFRAAVNISSPFFTTYMLQEIDLSFAVYSMLTAIPLITKTLCLTNWARLLDDNRKFEGLAIATVSIGAVPIMWAFWSSPEWLSILQVISGLSWAGFDLISILLVQNMYPRSITQKLGLYMALSSIGSVFGGVIGGLILRYSGDYHVLFAVSGVLRLATGFAFLWYLRTHHLFRFHDLKLKSGLATLMTVRPTIEAAAKILPLPGKRESKSDTAA
jgi:hypothetical protein